EAAERDVAAVVGDRRPHARLDQLFDGGNGFGILLLEEVLAFARRGRVRAAYDWSAGHEVLHDDAKDRGLELLPFAVGLGDGDEIGAEKYPGDPCDLEQAFGQRRLRGRFLVAHVERAARQHGPSRQEFERCRIRGRLGLDEHGLLLIIAQDQEATIGSLAYFNRWRRAVEVSTCRVRAGRRATARWGTRPRLSLCPRTSRRAERGADHDMASSSSSLRWPGTIATGMGKSPAVLLILETSGPGPSLLVAAASTRMAMSSSSSMRLRTSCAFSPSRITRCGITPVMLDERAAWRSSTAFASSCASARMMSATPSHC